MLDLSDPDGKSNVLNSQTVLSFQIPAFSNPLLSGIASAAWEQAVVVYVDGARQNTQLGTFGRANLLTLGQSSRERNLLLAGWHKQSGPDSDVPWAPSRGRFNATETAFEWEDAGDDDFNDYRIVLTDLAGVIHAHSAQPSGSHHFSPGSLVATVNVFALLAASKKTKSKKSHPKAVGPADGEWFDQAADGLLRQYLEGEPAECSVAPLSRGRLLAAQLRLLAATLHDEDLRREIERLAERALEGPGRLGARHSE